MALKGTTNEERIWNFCIGKGMSKCGAAGLMGNIYAESGLVPTNLQNSFEKKLGYTDAAYTAAVDNGSYKNFVRDSAGYGLCQWTYWSRKQALFAFCQSKGTSIGDLEMQLEFMYKELSENYGTVLSELRSATSVLQASNAVLLKYERPADQSSAVQSRRASYGQVYYDKFASKTTQTEGGKTMGYTNSSLVDCVVKSPNHSGRRTHSIDRLTPHCVVGQLSAESIGSCFTSSSVQASCNYGIGKDGRVVLCVDEANRSWCSSSNANDQRAITIECASGMKEPYEMNDVVYEKLIKLCADICRRNGKNKVVWKGSKEAALAYEPKSNEMVLTAHRFFANKSCPGNWLYSRYSDLANRINALLGSGSTSTGGNTSGSTSTTTPSKTNTNFPNTPFTVNVLVSDLNIRKTPNGDIVGQTGKGVFTITTVSNGWGKLKSGAGWIYLANASYCTIGSTVSDGDIVGQTGKGVFTITTVSNGWGKLKSGAGWIYLANASYCTIGSTVSGSSSKPAASNVPYKVRVDASDLRIRSGAGTNYPTTGGYTGKGTFTIVDEKAGTGSTKGWGKLKSGAGWISLDYCVKL